MIRHQLQLKRCVKSCSNLDMLQALKRMKEQLQRLSPMNHEINLIMIGLVGLGSGHVNSLIIID